MISVKLEQPSPPKQLFANDIQKPSVPRAMLVKDDSDKDCKPIKVGAIKGSADDDIGGDEGATANGKEHTNNLTTDGQ